MNELDFILLFVILVGIAIGMRRGLIRVLLSIVGIYFTVLVAGYVYDPMADTLTDGLGLGITMMTNFSYLVILVATTVAVEVASRSFFEGTRIVSIGALDNLLGGIVGILYGALWASLLLVPAQFGVATTGGVWTDAIRGSTLVPILNDIFRTVVLDVVRILFIDGIPPLYWPSL
jgi:uncharacterized membrane protein required for colicin V production